MPINDTHKTMIFFYFIQCEEKGNQKQPNAKLVDLLTSFSVSNVKKKAHTHTRISTTKPNVALLKHLSELIMSITRFNHIQEIGAFNSIERRQ